MNQQRARRKTDWLAEWPFTVMTLHSAIFLEYDDDDDDDDDDAEAAFMYIGNFCPK